MDDEEILELIKYPIVGSLVKYNKKAPLRPSHKFEPLEQRIEKRKREQKEKEKERIREQKINNIKTSWINENGFLFEGNNRSLKDLKKKLEDFFASIKRKRHDTVMEALL
mmetsp:Transcript_46919/g.34351  ORF Transcript_46919/g.34351 Transcript_46919/m.34351 type:complete len:110 (+) Transcript_46919:581-910(+)